MRNNDTDDERAQHVKSQNTVDVPSGSFGDVAPRSLAFTGCVADDFRRQNVREARADDCVPHCEELAGVATSAERLECARVVPVSKTKTVVVRRAAKEDDDANDDEDYDGNDFDGREPEFRLAVVLDCDEVQQYADYSISQFPDKTTGDTYRG